MPRIAVRPQPAPKVEIRHYRPPRPGNDAHDAAVPALRGPAGTNRPSFGMSTPYARTYRALEEARRRMGITYRIDGLLTEYDARLQEAEDGEAPGTYGNQRAKAMKEVTDAARSGVVLVTRELVRAIFPPLPGGLDGKYSPEEYGWVLYGLLPAHVRVAHQLFLEGYEWMGTLFQKQNNVRLSSDSGWRMSGICQGGTGNGWSMNSNNLGSFSQSCLGGQNIAESGHPDTYPANTSYASWVKFTINQATGVKTAQHIIGYNRTFGTNQGTTERYHPAPRGRAMINPNLQRFINLTPQPIEHPVTRPQQRVEQQGAIEISVGQNRPQSRPSSRTMRAARSQPPKPGVKEQKGTAGKVGAAIFNVLDGLSEGADVIDALYKALPKDVRVRWDRPNRPADVNGQYGVSGADWKIQALYHNWHRLNVSEAIKNVVYNQVEDALYGRAYAAKDRLTGRGRYRKRGGPFG